MKKHRVLLFGLSAASTPLVLGILAGDPTGTLRQPERMALAESDDGHGRGLPSDGPQDGNCHAWPSWGRYGNFDALTNQNTSRFLTQGKETFRFDTFGDEAFWGGQLGLHRAIATLSPTQVLDLGLKVDVDALSPSLVKQILRSHVNLNDPAVTVELLRHNAVLGVTGFFGRSGHLESVGIQCALCHSTVNDSVAPGIGRRLDGWANHDLNIGAIIASAPNVEPFVDKLRVVIPNIDADTVRTVFRSWGPGKFDAELLLDGKAFQPNGEPAATLIPNAFDMGGFNLHTWTGGWGSVPYWNAFVAVIEMQGIGTFFDERFDNAAQFPIAAAPQFRLGHVSVDPDEDRVTPKLPALHFYQLALPSPKPEPWRDFDPVAAALGDELFSGKADCNSCHHEPLWTEPGWNDHSPGEMRIDPFQADRSPDHAYKTMNLAGLFVRENGLFMKPANRGRFYHDGRFKTLLDVVESYNERFGLNLTVPEQRVLVEYLKSL